MSDVKEILNKYVPDVEQTIQAALEVASPFIRGMVGYHFGWLDQESKLVDFRKGKFLRPTLCLLTFEALQASYQAALPVAACLELIHNFSLVHDDIEDGDTERHGRPTVWAIWGKPLAINTGDFLYTLAFKCLYQLDVTRFGSEPVFGVQQLINQACLALTIGQDLDLRFEQLQDVTAEMYLDMVGGKTAALLEASIVSGAMLGTTNPLTVNHFRDFARNLGVAFQVRDDILGLWGDSAETGKSVDNDLRRKKKTLPVIYTLSQLTGPRRMRLQKIYADSTPMTGDQIEFARECLQVVDAFNYTQGMVNRYVENSFSALNQIDNASSCQAELGTLAHYLVTRTK